MIILFPLLHIIYALYRRIGGNIIRFVAGVLITMLSYIAAQNDMRLQVATRHI